MQNKLLSFVLLQFAVLTASIAQADDYQLGQGWRAGNYYFSGYVNAEVVDRFGSPMRLDLDDLSAFAGGKINQWINPFLEVELSGHTLVRQGGGARNGDLIVERFYNDVLFSERDTLRIGKILTPLGDWNVVHAAPLVPIITRPYTAVRGFAGYMSGINWIHEEEQGLISDVQLYLQPGDELFKRPVTQTIRNFHNVIGGQVNKSWSMKDRLGLSFQHGTLIESGESYILLGINAAQSFGKLKLEGEAISAKFSGMSPRAHDTEEGIFVLADYAVTSQWHGIAEVEYYQDHTVAPSSRSTLLAVNYKPSDVPVVWKLEYIHQAGMPSPIANVRTGVKGSLSFFF
ncbi:MAG: hypothetical protein HOO95_06845 [Gallionella sp.]|nr:hypothetical protein [Gallionella sp.]